MQDQGIAAGEPSGLPRTARAMSVMNGKPVHLHRVIKDRSNSVVVAPTALPDKRPALLPIPVSGIENVRSPLEPCLQGGPSGLLKLEKVGSAESDTKDFLRRRIKELEKEVLKLNNHIQQAELSIKNYRVSLSEKSPRVGFGKGRECGMQTDPDDTSILQSNLKAAQDKIVSLTEELRSAKTAKDAMFAERKQLHEANKRKEEFMLNTVQTNEDTISKLNARIKSLEAEVGMNGSAQVSAASSGTVVPVVQDSHTLEKLLVTLTETQKLRQELTAIKGKVTAEAAQLFSALTADCLNLVDRIQRAADKAVPSGPVAMQLTPAPSEALELENTLLRAQLQESVDQCQALRTQITVLKADNAILTRTISEAVKQTAEKCTNTDPARTLCDASTSTQGISPLSTPVKPVLPPSVDAVSLMIDAAASPLSPLANRSYNAAAVSAAAGIQADLLVQAKLRLAEREAELSDLQARVERDGALLKQQSDDLDALRQRLLSERGRFDQICREQEQQLAQRAAQCASHQQRADMYLQRLGTAAQALAGLQEVHAAEVKAVRHEAHIKDLQRVAKEREADIERDRLQIELKHIKEVQSILTFSLSTAEQSLNEVLPHVVVKLVQGREKRLKLLEQTTNGRRRDLDQRSADTCAVNSAHLDGFQKKAASNNAAAKEMTHAAVTRLLGILRVAEDPPPSTSGSPTPLGSSSSRAKLVAGQHVVP